VKTAYVIATFGGPIRKTFVDPTDKIIPFERYLSSNLSRLFSCKTGLINSIIIVCPDKSSSVSGFYDLPNLTAAQRKKIKVVECENYGGSYGQWLTAFEQFGDFDRYILVEDDYVLGDRDAIKILLDMYDFVSDDETYLASHIQERDGFPLHAAVSNGVVSRNALESLYKRFANPKKVLMEPLGQNFSLIGNRSHQMVPQVAFSLMFPSIHSLTPTFAFPFWVRTTGEVFYVGCRGSCKSPFVPIQFLKTDLTIMDFAEVSKTYSVINQ